MTIRYRAGDLRTFAYTLLCKKGMQSDLAGTVANVLLEGDLLGHTTHGLQLLEPYLNELDEGKMTPEGDPEIVQDHGMSVLLMMIDPEALGGRERFVEETSWIAKACLDGEPIDSDNPVRLPGQSALAKKRRYLKDGVELEPGILPALEKWSAALSAAVPEPSVPKK